MNPVIIAPLLLIVLFIILFIIIVIEWRKNKNNPEYINEQKEFEKIFSPKKEKFSIKNTLLATRIFLGFYFSFFVFLFIWDVLWLPTIKIILFPLFHIFLIWFLFFLAYVYEYRKKFQKNPRGMWILIIIFIFLIYSQYIHQDSYNI